VSLIVHGEKKHLELRVGIHAATSSIPFAAYCAVGCRIGFETVVSENRNMRGQQG
jgi:hypothetical protein